MKKILPFEEFVKQRGEAKAIFKQYVLGHYRSKMKDKLLQDNPKIKKKQLNKKLQEAEDEFRNSQEFADLVEAVPLEMVSESLNKAYQRYCEITRISIERDKMKEAIEAAIPEHIKDAYPKARMLKRKFILHVGPTNSGKTFAALERFREAHEAVYLAPLRLLALEVYENSNETGIDCSLLTGEEESFMEGASHISETIEMADMNKYYDVAVIDECQLIEDRNRGGAWTEAILGLCAEEIHICMAPQAENIVSQLIEYCGDEIVEIDRRERMTPLVMDTENFSFPRSVKPGDALIVFSKHSVIGIAAELQSRNIKCSIIYGDLPYETRKSETERFLRGETQIVVATDAIGMGLNLPIKRVVFLEIEKFNGYEKRLLEPEEVQQIAGRAGRKGLYDKGEYTAGRGRKFIRESMEYPFLNIKFACVHFPSFLVNIEGKLSEVMLRWFELESESLFTNNSIYQQVDLCKWLEKYTEDKKVTYQLINVSFNSKNKDILSLWQTLSIHVVEEHVFDSASEIETLFKEEQRISAISDTNQHIQELEVLYQKYDLIHNFVRLFGVADKRNENKELLRKRRKAVSDELITVLMKKKLNRRHCSECGWILPYNYPHRLCERCYRRLSSKRWFWDDDFY